MHSAEGGLFWAFFLSYHTPAIVTYYNGRSMLEHPVTLVVEERLRGRSVARFAKVSGSHI